MPTNKKKKTPREPLFVRIKKVNKSFIEKETKRVMRETESLITTQDTVDNLVAGYRRLKKLHPTIAAKFF